MFVRTACVDQRRLWSCVVDERSFSNFLTKLVLSSWQDPLVAFVVQPLVPKVAADFAADAGCVD